MNSSTDIEKSNHFLLFFAYFVKITGRTLSLRHICFAQGHRHPVTIAVTGVLCRRDEKDPRLKYGTLGTLVV